MLKTSCPSCRVSLLSSPVASDCPLSSGLLSLAVAAGLQLLGLGARVEMALGLPCSGVSKGNGIRESVNLLVGAPRPLVLILGTVVPLLIRCGPLGGGQETLVLKRTVDLTKLYLRRQAS